MGNPSINLASSPELDLSLTNIWECWFKFRRGKTKTDELEIFTYYLERNLQMLHFDLNNGRYKSRRL